MFLGFLNKKERIPLVEELMRRKKEVEKEKEAKKEIEKENKLKKIRIEIEEEKNKVLRTLTANPCAIVEINNGIAAKELEQLGFKVVGLFFKDMFSKSYYKIRVP